MRFEYVTSSVFSKLVFYLLTITEVPGTHMTPATIKRHQFPFQLPLFFSTSSLSPTNLKNVQSLVYKWWNKILCITELYKPVTYYRLSLNLWSYKYCGIRRACSLSSRQWFGETWARFRWSCLKKRNHITECCGRTMTVKVTYIWWDYSLMTTNFIGRELRHSASRQNQKNHLALRVLVHRVK